MARNAIGCILGENMLEFQKFQKDITFCFILTSSSYHFSDFLQIAKFPLSAIFSNNNTFCICYFHLRPNEWNNVSEVKKKTKVSPKHTIMLNYRLNVLHQGVRERFFYFWKVLQGFYPPFLFL